VAFISATLQQAFGRAYRYDMLGRFDDPNFGISQNCPTFVDSLNYSYDNVGNRTDLGATYYVGNRLALFSGGWYTYDADGNVHQKYGVNPNPHNQIFYWNPENRLDSLSYDGYYNVTYKYNALGKPVLKYRQGTLDGVWLWDGDTWLAEFTPSNYRDSEYLYNGTDEPYASVEGSTTPSSIHYHVQDELGNVLGTYAGTTVTETISYDPWGVPTYTGDLSSRVMWKGLMWEGGPATGDVVGLYYVRGRWYDPQAGRFVQEDPMGVDGGINVYTFAGDDPINGSDPTGMDPGDVCQELMMYSYGSQVWFGWQDTQSTECLDGGGSGSDPGFDPFAGDPAWVHGDPPGPIQTGDGHNGGGVGSGQASPQQIFTAVGRELTPFNNAMNHGMNCAERSGEFFLGLTGDRALWKVTKQIFSRLTIASLVTRTLSMGATTATVSTVSVGSTVVVNLTAAREAGHLYAEGVAQTGGFNFIHGDDPLLSYVPGIGTWAYAGPAAVRACAPGSSQ